VLLGWDANYSKCCYLNEYARKSYLIVTAEPTKINQKSPQTQEIHKHFAIE
jgi:hypothetical protein